MTPQEFSQATGATLPRVTEHMHHIEHAMAVFDINTPARQAAFLSQIGHESGGLKWIRELWGPTDAQRRYEVRGDLGNNQPGDGRRYAGRGWIQLTGRDNYRRAYQRLKERFPDCPDFEADPERVATPRWAALTAAEFWHNAGCNKLADEGRFERLTRVINGGLNGYADRLARWEDAKQALA
jgi:putative chitinase